MNLVKGLADKAIKSNPVFVLMLGLCPTLAVTTSVKNALYMAAAASAVLLCSNVLISLIKGLVPKEVRIACYVVVIAGFVTMVEIIMKGAAPAEVNKDLGIFIPLIVVNCIILGRAEAFASRNGLLASMGDAIGIGIGYALALVLIGFIREFVGTGAFFGYQLIPGYVPASLAIMAPGAFIIIGLLFGLFNLIGNRRQEAALAGLAAASVQTSADFKDTPAPAAGSAPAGQGGEKEN